MQEKDFAKQAVEGVLDLGKTIEIPVLANNGWQRILQKIGFKKKTLVYTLRKIRVGNRERIAVRMDGLPVQLNDGTPFLKKIFSLSKDHTGDFIYSAAVALQNDANEPTEELLYALRWVDDEFLFSILQRSFEEIDAGNFLNSIVLISGTESLMKTETE